MFRSALLGFLLITLIFVSIYWLRVPIVTVAANHWLLPPTVQLDQLQGLTVDPDGISVKQLVLSVDNSTQSVHNIYLPVSGWANGQLTIDIEKVILNLPTFSAEQSQQQQTQYSLRQLLQRIVKIPIAQLTVKEIVAKPLPYPLSINWKKNNRELVATIKDPFTVLDMAITYSEPTTPHARIGLNTTTEPSVGTMASANVTLTIEPSDNHLLTIATRFNPQNILRWIHHYVSVPPMLQSINGTLAFSSSGTLSDKLQLSDLTLDFTDSTALKTSLIFQQPKPTTLELTVLPPDKIIVHHNPAGSFSVSGLDFAVSNHDYQATLQGQLISANCQWAGQSLPACSATMTGTAEIDQFNAEQWQLGKSQLTLSADLSTDATQLLITIADTLRATSTQARFAAVDIDTLQLLSEGPMQIKLTLASELTVAAEKLQLLLPRIQSDAINAATRITVSDIQWQQTMAQNAAAYPFNAKAKLSAESINVRYRNQWLPATAVQTDITLKQSQLTVSGHLKSDRQLELAGFNAQYNLADNRGALKIPNSDIRIESSRPLSQYFSNWPLSWDVQQGHWSANAALLWQNDTLTGRINHQLHDMSGQINNSAFIDLNTKTTLDIKALQHVKTASPATVNLASADIGIPIDAVSASFSFDSLTKQLDMHRVKARLLGGQVVVDDAHYTLGQRGVIDVQLQALDVTEALSLTGYEAVRGGGLISGRLPLLIDSDKLIIELGELAAEAPGGVITYTPLTPASNPSVEWVNKALSNYHYDTLDAKVRYLDNGDLNLKIAMKGKNPDLNQGQAINLNLNITDNIPMLLKSLQAGRTVTDVVERKLRQRSSPPPQ